MDFVKRCWAEIDLDNIVYNYRLYESFLSDHAQLIAVVKANAYGHGANEVSRELELNGCKYFAVSNVIEAKNLRLSGIKSNIMILGYTPVENADLLIKYDVIQTVHSLEYALFLNGEADRLHAKLAIAVKIDSGMGRIGFVAADSVKAVEQITQVSRLSSLIIVSCFTHFCVADKSDEPSRAFTKLQAQRFSGVVGALRGSGVVIPMVHCCNSAEGFFDCGLHMDAVRLGISLYGLSPTNTQITNLPLKQVMSLKTVVTQVKTIREGDSVSYGRKFIADKPTQVASLCIGYADGYNRKLTNNAVMLVNNKIVRQIGTICMDQTMIDASGIEVKMGDVVTVMGDFNGGRINEIANVCNTINYEITCNISARVPRVFIRGGEIVGVVDHTY